MEDLPSLVHGFQGQLEVAVSTEKHKSFYVSDLQLMLITFFLIPLPQSLSCGHKPLKERKEVSYRKREHGFC